MILAGDIGGTNTRLLLCDPGTLKPIREDVLPSRSFRTFEAAVLAFLGPLPPVITAAAFGIAGPVIGGAVATTNLPWRVDEASLSRRLGTPRVRLMNDLVAIGFGAVAARGRKVERLQGGPPRVEGANVAVIAAGTGLGEAGLVWDGKRLVPCGSEGGHGDFAPRTDLEWELRTYLGKILKRRVSYEQVVSGPGIGHIYDFFIKAKRKKESAPIARALAAAPDRNRLISELGLAGRSRTCAAALDLFVRVYGAEAGNLALRFTATGGVFLAGGIAASILPLLRKGPFLDAFLDKGRLRPLLERTPVSIILDSNVGLSGAARFAASMLQS